MDYRENFTAVLKRYKSLGDTLSHGCDDPKAFAKLSKEYSDLGDVAEKITTYLKMLDDRDEMETILEDAQQDSEMKKLAEDELYHIKHKLPDLCHQIQLLLLPKDEADDKNAIIEIRAGTGGEEAALFAGDLLRMYQRYAENKGWKTEILSISDADMGGVKEAVLSVHGKGAFSRFKFESGAHRVQRVPATESSGRIHTSAATVAVLPEVEAIDIEINEKDLRIDTFRASGAGGQHVNKTESAIRITHIPTGVVVSQQDEKSQHKNKDRAMKILRARLYEMEREKRDSERAASRKLQVGSGDRSERIRTYNFPQGRVTDHRINFTLYKIEQIMLGEGLDELMDALILDHQSKQLNALNEEN